jgi:citrate lyase beta subunit
MLIACRAYRLRPIDGAFRDFSDAEGFSALQKGRVFSAMKVNGQFTITN